MRLLIRSTFTAILVCLLLTGCSWFNLSKPLEKSAQALARDGMTALKAGQYDTAIENFEKLKDWYPFSKFAILAELKIAEAYYRLENFQEAVAAYENFEKLHPRNEAVPYVVYQIGRCYFEQLDTVDRDQVAAQKALESFRRLNRQFPGHPYKNKVADHIRQCLKSMAGHELYVGMYYMKTKAYQAALSRFQSVLTKYPDVGVHRTAIQYLTLCEETMRQQKPEK